MKTITSTIFFAALGLGLSLGFGGCAATQVALEHKDLSVQTQMSATVFLDLESRVQKSLFLEVKNTSSFDLSIEPLIKARLVQAGYQLQTDPQDAFYILQVNILHVGTANPSALHESLRTGWGGPLGGGLAGAGIGATTSINHGQVKGALIGSAVEMVAGSLVKNITYSIITDIQITARTEDAVVQKEQSNFQHGTDTQIVQSSDHATNRKKIRTRIISTANQVNLKFAEALPPLEQQLARAIAGIF